MHLALSLTAARGACTADSEQCLLCLHNAYFLANWHGLLLYFFLVDAIANLDDDGLMHINVYSSNTGNHKQHAFKKLQSLRYRHFESRKTASVLIEQVGHQNQDMLLNCKRHLHTESECTGHTAFWRVRRYSSRGHSTEGSIIDDFKVIYSDKACASTQHFLHGP